MQYLVKFITELSALGFCLYCCLHHGIRKDKAYCFLSAWVIWNVVTEIAACVYAFVSRNNLTVYSICSPIRFALSAGYFHFCHPIIRKYLIAVSGIGVLIPWYFITLYSEGIPARLNTLFLQAECIAMWSFSVLYLYLSVCYKTYPDDKGKRAIAVGLLLSNSACFVCRTFIGISTDLDYPTETIHQLYSLNYLFGILPYPWIAFTMLSTTTSKQRHPHV